MLSPPLAAPTLRIAIYRATSLGDVVLATACLDLLSHLKVPTEITWLGRGAALEVIGRFWPKVRTIEIPRDQSMLDLQAVVSELSDTHLFVDLQCNLRSGWLARHLKAAHGVPYFAAEKVQLARSRLIVEARVRGRRRPLPLQCQETGRHQYELMCDALRRALVHHLPEEMRDGLDHVAARPRLVIPDDFDPPWRKELRFGAWLAIAPGAAHATKQAPLPVLHSIVERVGRHLTQSGTIGHPVGLVCFGDASDRQTALDLLNGLSWNGPVLNLAGRLSLWESAVALRESSCLLSNDSSLSHIAEAVDTPVGVLFGPTVEAFGFAPRMPQSRAYSARLGCRPCSKHGKAPCRYGDKLCFSALDLDRIASHLASILAAPEAGLRRRPGAGALGRRQTHDGPTATT